MDKASCQAALKEAHDRINEEHRGIMGPHPPPMSKPPGEIYPLGASCANCKTDVSAQSDMKRCGACKMTRYVSILGFWAHKGGCTDIDGLKILRVRDVCARARAGG